MKVVMGPAVCKGCRALVWLARGGAVTAWVGRDGRRHVCSEGEQA